MNKTIFITGSTDGIGKLTALQLAKAQYTVYVHGRNQEKLDRTVSEIQSISKNEHVFGYCSDFSALQSVAQMATRFQKEVTQLDVLINNAGVFKSPISQTSEGLDLRFVVNYLAPYVLTNALLPVLSKSKAPRIINLSSAAQASVDLTALSGKVALSVQEAYAQSKLALTMWSFDLAKTYSDATVIAVNPGSLLNTKMANEAYGQHWSPASKGVQILLDLAISQQYQAHTGQYFDNDKGVFSKAHTDAYQPEKIQELLRTTAILVRS